METRAVVGTEEELGSLLLAPEDLPPAAEEREAGVCLPPGGVPLHERYSFETLVIGAFNRRGCELALEFAAGATPSGRPLFLQGGAGLGKTHLLHAAARSAAEGAALRPVLLHPAAALGAWLAAAPALPDLRVLRPWLFLDDLQEAEEAPECARALAGFLDTVVTAGGRLAVSADRPLGELPRLGPALRSLGCVEAQLAAPDLRARRTILKRRAEHAGAELDARTLDRLARGVVGNTRLLEAALLRAASLAGSIPVEEAVTQTLAVFRTPDTRVEEVLPGLPRLESS